MSSIRLRPSFATAFLLTVFALALLRADSDSQNSSLSPSPTPHKTVDNSAPSAGAINHGVYRNSFFGFSCKIPEGWVLRTDEMNLQNVPGGVDATAGSAKNLPNSGRVLLAAFSRPPQAQGEDVNSSILIAAESVTAYPGLKEAAQYFGPVTEVAKSQGFEVDEEPYELAVGTKTLVRGDFEKDVGTRVMHQSTLVMLDHGYALSFTFIGGAEDEVDDLVGNLSLSHPPPR
jgi:hypothetical protein